MVDGSPSITGYYLENSILNYSITATKSYLDSTMYSQHRLINAFIEHCIGYFVAIIFNIIYLEGDNIIITYSTCKTLAYFQSNQQILFDFKDAIIASAQAHSVIHSLRIVMIILS